MLFLVWGFFFLQKSGYSFGKADVLVFVLFMLIGIVSFVQSMRKHKLAKEGIPPEDEMSRSHKFAAGYYAFFGSLGIWLLLLVFQSSVPDTDTLIGLGLAGSILVYVILHWVFNRQGIPRHEE